MPLWLEKRYANMISPKLALFKWKKPTLANFRCPYCGDSQKNKRKARGYLYTKGNGLFYKCHNCPASTNFSKFLEFVDPALHMEFVREIFYDRASSIVAEEIAKEIDKEIVQKIVNETVGNFKYISTLPEEHHAKQYILGRKIPTRFHDQIIFVENMKNWVHEYINEEIECPEEPCVAILIKDETGKIVGVNGRSLRPENKYAKYIKAKVNDDVRLIFGVDRLEKSQKVYVFEGEFDSMFLPNAIAVGGVGMMSGIENIIHVNKEQIIQVVDNDPRNKDVVRFLENLIEEGYSVAILPGNIEGKDVNELVKENKYDLSQIKALIDENTYSGLSARLKLSEWKKC